MVKKVVLYDKFPNITSERAKKDLLFNYLKYLEQHVKVFSKTQVRIKKLRNFDKRFEVEIKGPDEVFLMNLLRKEIGTITEFNDVKVGQEYKGSMIDVGKFGFGIFIDCAILNPKVDVLLNLITLRKQLCNGNEKSTRDIIKAYNFINNFPIYTKIVNIDIKNDEIQGEIAEKSLKLFKKILDERIEAIFASGATKSQLKKSLIKTGHLRDIISITRYSFLDNIVLFKENTNAPGIISNVGKYLRNCKLIALRYENMNKLL
ncbi:MAG: DUF2110 family protein [Promethearchaeota archaeon]